jgi:hypothetical protein
MRQKFIPSKTYIGFANRIRFWQPVIRNGWSIKFSVHDDTDVLLIIISKLTGQTIIRYFNNEDEACEFINYIMNQASSPI